MSHRALAGLVGVAWSLAACESESSSAPIDLELRLCAQGPPSWFAYRNEGQPWIRLEPSSAGSFAFSATSRVSIAYVYASGTSARTEVVHAANTELAELQGRICFDSVGPLEISGKVAWEGPSTPQQVAVVTVASGRAIIYQAGGAFVFKRLPHRSLDIVVTKDSVWNTGMLSQRLLIRRAQSLQQQEDLGVVDMASAAIQTNPFTVTVSPSADMDSQVQTWWMTSLGTRVLLSVGPGRSVPPAFMLAGEVHEVLVNSLDGQGGRRMSFRFLREPAGNVALEIGPSLQTPTISRAGFGGVSAQLPRSPDYGDAVVALYYQGSTSVVVTETRGFSAAGAWAIELPDFSTVTGWNSNWQLRSDLPVGWFVRAVKGRPGLVLGMRAVDGDALRWAGRGGQLP